MQIAGYGFPRKHLIGNLVNIGSWAPFAYPYRTEGDLPERSLSETGEKASDLLPDPLATEPLLL